MALFDAVVVFVVSALVGGFGIFVGATLLADERGFEHAVWTALIGALVWTVAGALLGWIPLAGPVLTLLAYLGVIKWRYRGGWITAAGIALVGWVAASLALALLSWLGLVGISATGIPLR
ncbi:hypothetical protein [Halobaculum sp. P14]|uniref:hypothetical protein n=1 Tax=Halobaculum sp. P14 TaxID=3421638 RepID=UPI003EB8C41A